MSTSTSDEKAAEEDTEEREEEEDISTSLEKEVEQLRTLHEAPVSFRKFQVMTMDPNDCLYIYDCLGPF